MASPDRSALTTKDVVADILTSVGIPLSGLSSLHLPSADTLILPSSFKIGVLAQSTIAAAALAAAQYHALRNNSQHIPSVTVPLDHAALEFDSQIYQWLDIWAENPPDTGLNKIGGLHKTADGHVRIHDLFPNHVAGTLEILGLPPDATREHVAEKTLAWKAVDLETRATQEGSVAIYAQRSYAEWDAHPQSLAVSPQPILIRQLAPGPRKILPPPPPTSASSSKCLQGLRVVEMSRVIAAPVAGRTLAAHGADVLWVTSPNLPDVPFLDSDMSRGKRTVQLDIRRSAADRARLLELLRTADVFLQGYRPGSLAAHGLAPADLARVNPGLIVANLSAFGPSGPWSGRRGFDSLVQTTTGMTVSEAEHHAAAAGQQQENGASDGGARSMPVQALDHGSGQLLAAGVMAALQRRAVEGGSWVVNVSLAGTMKYLRSLGQYPGRTGFEGGDGTRRPANIREVPSQFVDVKESGFGRAMALKHAASIEGVEVGYDEAPKPLGSDEPKWRS